MLRIIKKNLCGSVLKGMIFLKKLSAALLSMLLTFPFLFTGNIKSDFNSFAADSSVSSEEDDNAVEKEASSSDKIEILVIIGCFTAAAAVSSVFTYKLMRKRSKNRDTEADDEK